MGENRKIIVRVDPEIQDLIPRFLENRRKAVKSILEALEREDYETVRILGHRMKGSGRGYGFTAISDIGGQVEQGAKERNSGAIRDRVGDLVTYLDRVEVVYE